jgi:hypothetical protein
VLRSFAEPGRSPPLMIFVAVVVANAKTMLLRIVERVMVIPFS